MSIAAAFFAVLTAAAAWWLLRQGLLTKPWLEEGPVRSQHSAGGPSPPAAKLGLWMFLAVIGSLFTLLLSAYSMRLGMAEMGMAGVPPPPVPKVLWLNTGLLTLSSAALEWARSAARRGRMDGVKLGLLAGAVLAFAFLQGQLLAWQQLRAEGYFLVTDQASAFFYLITGVHGLHLLGGIAAMVKAVARMRHGAGLAQVRLSVGLCATYWHFLLLVWLLFFTMLLLA